jgi:hypothetical protein
MVLQDYRFNNCLNGTYYSNIESLFINKETMNDPFYQNWKKRSRMADIRPIGFETLSLKDTIFKYFPTSFHPNQAIRTFAPWQII